jgi:hypothetical protein
LNACKLHAGVSVEVARVKGEATITAWSAIGEPAGGKSLDPGLAVLGVLQMSWLRLAAYGELLRRQVVTEGTEAGDPAEEDSPQSSGLIGFRYGAAGKDGVVYTQSEEIRALVALESAERDRVTRYAKVAHDMGISAKLVDLAEKWGDVVVNRLLVVIAGLDLTPEQEAKVPALIRAHLSSIDVGGGS